VNSGENMPKVTAKKIPIYEEIDRPEQLEILRD
jgi:hypothetical protein